MKFNLLFIRLNLFAFVFISSNITNYANSNDTSLYSLTTKIADSLYYEGKLSESANKYREARLIEEKAISPNPRRISESYGNEGYCYYKIGLYNKAIKLYTIALNVAASNHDSTEIATLYHNIGVVYYNLADYNKSIVSYNKALAIDEKLGDIENIAYDYIVIGNVFAEWQKFGQALDFHKKSLEIGRKSNNLTAIASRTRNVGSLFIAMHEFDSALNYFEESLEIEKKLNNKNNIVVCLNDIGHMYLQQGRHIKANTFFVEAIDGAKNIEELKTKAILYNNYGNNNFHIGQYNDALKYLNKSLDISRKISLQQTSSDNYEILGELHYKLGDYKKAYELNNRFLAIRDSIYSRENEKKLSDFQIRYETQEKEAVINDLIQQQQLKDLQLTNEQNKRKFALVIALLAILILFATVYVSYKLRSQNSELKTLNNTLKRMFSIISHDLRGAISSYQATGRILRHRINKNQVEMLPELADEVSKNSQQLSAMLDNLLNWSLSQIKNRNFEPKTTDISEIVKKEQALYQPIAEKKNNCLVNSIEQNTLVFADGEHLQLIFRNLISNAIKFTENGTIELSAHKSNSHLNVVIKDSGTGITQTAAHQIFDINEKKIKRGTQNEKGTGLGLNLVKEYVELNKGLISFKSEPGKGTEFIIKLPVNKPV